MGFFSSLQNHLNPPARTAYFPLPATSHPITEGPTSVRSSHAHPHFFAAGGFLGRSRCVICTIAGVLALAASPRWMQAQAPEPAGQLIRETIYNELQDHNNHGYWRYWIQQKVQNDTRLAVQVETIDGPVSRLVQTNGHPIDSQTREEEQARFDHLLKSPDEQANHRKDYLEDEKHVARVMRLFPDAYIFEYAGEENGCHHLRFRPDPAFEPHTVEARVAHAMAGDVWIDARMKRLSHLEGHLMENVDFAFGLLGRVDKGGWFRVQRVQVSPAEWKTQSLELHLSGRAIVFKTIARDTDEVRGGFAAVPAGLNLTQGLRLLERPDLRLDPGAVARISPASWTTRH
jgi:hypothetical protein